MLTTTLLIIIGIIVTAALITFLVTIHELGHFITARFFKVKVEEFGIGFPIPGRIWQRKKGDTVYSIGTLPAGGFVRLYGEEEEKNDPKSFSSKPAWQRAVIIVAGVVINLLFAFFLFTIIVGGQGFKSEIPLVFADNQFPFGRQENQVFIDSVEENSPAFEAGLKPADRIVSINNTPVTSAEQLISQVDQSNGEPIRLQVENLQETDRQTREITADPELRTLKDENGNDVERYRIGVGLSKLAVINYSSVIDKIFVGPLHSANMLQYQYVVMKQLFSQSVEEGSPAPLTDNVSGVVGISGVVILLIQAVGFGSVIPLLTLMALMSLLLGIINVLPIPAVDGGRLFFTLIELVTRRKVNPTVERVIHTLGFAVLIVLFLFITANDVLKFFR